MHEWDFSNLGFGGVLWLIVVVWAVISIFNSAAGNLSKALWSVVVILFPVAGFFIWLIFGPKAVKRLESK